VPRRVTGPAETAIDHAFVNTLGRMDHTATVGASVFEEGGIWLLALESSTGDVVEVIPTGWDGLGGFEQRGLDFVAPLLAERGLRYQRWIDAYGRYVAVLHRRPDGGPR